MNINFFFFVICFLCQTIHSANDEFDFEKIEKSAFDFGELDKELQAQIQAELKSKSDAIPAFMINSLYEKPPPKDGGDLEARIKRLLSFHQGFKTSGKNENSFCIAGLTCLSDLKFSFNPESRPITTSSSTSTSNNFL